VDGAQGVLIKDCMVHDVANGAAGAGGAGDGIVLGGAYLFTGLVGTYNVPATESCTVINCNVTKCTGYGIRDDSSLGNNLVTNNYSFNNTLGNYLGVPAASIKAQGDPAVVGENMLP